MEIRLSGVAKRLIWEISVKEVTLKINFPKFKVLIGQKPFSVVRKLV